MDVWVDHVVLSWAQFTVTAMSHRLWPVLTVGLSVFLFLVAARR
jgi:cytochrome d ubiquinol oxidase subunit I